MSAPASVVAAFDVDGTLTRRDCVTPFLRRLGGGSGIGRSLAKRPVASFGALVRRDRDRLKELVVGGMFAGRDVDEVRRLGAVFANEVARDSLRPDTVGRLRWHQRAGHATVLVSASLRPYLDPLASRLGVDAVLCTDVRSEGGVYTAQLDGGNCRGPRKAELLLGWMADRGLADAELWAYGDSPGDREMLALASHPHLVRSVALASTPARRHHDEGR